MHPSALRLENEYRKLKAEGPGMAVGVATSMEKILPRDMPFELSLAENIEISLARNEKESFQIAVLAVGKDLSNVSVTVGQLTSADGKIFSADHIDSEVVGFVKTTNPPPYEVSYVGWWPDPILDFLDSVDIAEGDLQSFWIRIRASKNQSPSTYRGAIRVTADGGKVVELGLIVKIRSFTLPDHPPIPTAISLYEAYRQVGGEENWEKMKFEYADFLADYYIDYDNLYRSSAPDYEIYERLHDQGRLVAFNLGNVFNRNATEEGFDQALAETVERIRIAYDEAPPGEAFDSPPEAGTFAPLAWSESKPVSARLPPPGLENTGHISDVVHNLVSPNPME